MKEGWTYKKLGEVCDYSIGLTYKPTDVCDNGTIVLRSSNIQNGQIDLNDIVRVSCPIKDSLFVNKGDILMCSRNGSARLVGKVAIIPDIKERMTYGTFMMIIRSDYNPFLFYYFNSDIFRKQIKHGEANMINQITRYMLDDVVVSLPPLSDQQRIVSRLDAAFSHIDELKANAEKQLSEARALFQKSLAKAMEQKKGWEEKCLGKLCDIFGRIGFRGYTTKDLVSSAEEGAISLSPSNIQDGKMDFSKCTYISWYKYEESPEIKIFNGDILLVKTGSSYGKSALVEDLPHESTINPQSVVLKNSRINNKYLAYYLRTNTVLDEFDKFVSGTAIPTFSQAKLSTVIISYPPLSEQQRIVERLDALSAHVRELEENQKKIISECDALKQALLRKVFE